MKIGIFTFFYGANYGAQAHSYALYQTLTKMGHNCEFVYYYPKSKFRILFRNMLMVMGYRKGIVHPIRSLKAVARLGLFKEFHSGYKFSRHVHTGQEIDSLGYDLVIFGSDEIFKINHPFFSKVNYGVGVVKTPKITYAPSSGQTEVTTVLTNDIKESLKIMVDLSARDKHTAELMQNNCHRDVKIVLDPTLLYDFSTVAPSFFNEGYILIYAFCELDEYKERIKEHAAKNGFIVISIARHRHWADKSYASPTVSQWLGAFSHAALVITDSFHGTIFSIKGQRQFINTGFTHNVNKVTDLLEDMNISRPYYTTNESISRYMAKYPITYKKINVLIEQKRISSLEYLENSLRAVSNCNLQGE